MSVNLFQLIFDIFYALIGFAKTVTDFINYRIDDPVLTKILDVDYITPLQICSGVGLVIIVIAVVVKAVVPLL